MFMYILDYFLKKIELQIQAKADEPKMAALAPSKPLIRNLALPLYNERTCSL